MALLTPSLGELELLDKMLKDALSTDENYILKLYTNNITPSDADQPGSYTEATFTAYAARTLARTTWNASVQVSNKAETSYGAGPQSWTCGATGQTVYGYYVTGASSAVVLWGERFSTSRVLADGDVLNIQPKFSLNKEV